MIQRKPLVLDANILIRAVLGVRVRRFILTSLNDVALYAPDLAFEDARRYLPLLAVTRGLAPARALSSLGDIVELIEIVEHASYAAHKTRAEKRISHRDPDDWPIVATALLLDAPIWTEDQDFFGCGVATWITATVEQYLRP